MRDGVSGSKERVTGVCTVCHGSKGTGGIFGCKCADNSRLLAGLRGRGKGNGEPQGPADSLRVRVAPWDMVEYEVRGRPLLVQTNSACCESECPDARRKGGRIKADTTAPIRPVPEKHAGKSGLKGAEGGVDEPVS